MQRPRHDDTQMPARYAPSKVPDKEVMRAALLDTNKFRELCPSNATLLSILRTYERDDEPLCRDIIHFLIKHHAEFDMLFARVTDVSMLTRLNHKEFAEEILRHIFADPTEFDRLIKKEKDLKLFYHFFPNHPNVFTKMTVAEAKEAAKLEASQFKK